MGFNYSAIRQLMKFEYKGVNENFEPYVQTFDIIDTDSINRIIKCIWNGESKEFSFELFNFMLDNKQLKLV